MEPTTRYDGQLDLVNVNLLDLPITIVGAGGIGSFTTLALAKMGCSSLTVYDDDMVENHNIASQFFKESHLNFLKVDALKESVLEQTGIEIIGYQSKIEKINIEDPLIIIAVDSMKVRNELAQKYKNTNKYIIDGRMGGLQMEIYNMPASYYPNTIVTEQEIIKAPCTAKAISFNCMVIGGLIANLVRQYVQDEIVPGSLIYLFEENTLLKRTFDSVLPQESQSEE